MARVRKSVAEPAPRKKGKVASGKGRGGARGGLGSWLRAFVGYTLLGAALGVGAVTAVLYRGALATVDQRLGGAVWSLPGHVWSGPVEVWPGLRAAPEELADDLVAAGYARVATAEKPGDFQVSGDGVLLKPRTGKKGDVLVAFRDGRVSSITPGGRFVAERAALATLRGPDNENRSPVPLARIPKAVKDAVLAMEDARFYENGGVDPIGIARALWVDLLHRELAQGGSTLTQQLAKNLFLSQDRTAGRKLREVLLTWALEKRLDKDAILQLYLSEIYLGQAGSSAVCGVDAAARAYFGKPVERVTLGEAATLAGIIASPNAWSPIRHADLATERRDLALDRMVDAGFVDAAAAAAEKKEPLVVHPAVVARQAPYATDQAVEEVEASVGEGAVNRQGIEVHTAIVPALQRLAEDAVAEGGAELVRAYPKLAEVQIALVAVRARDGAVVALVGGRDYATSNYDRAVASVRQIGSTVKPLTLLVALEADPDLGPATVFDDAPITRTHDGKAWSPTNYDGTFVGPISLRRAVALSRNVPAVLLAERVGLGTLRDRWRGLGLSRATDFPSAALGGFGATPTELAGAYAVFAGDGAVRAPWIADDATDADGRVLWRRPAAEAGTRYSARARWLATDVLRTVMAEGTGKNAAKYGVGPGATGKSGTTDGYKDAWFAGTTGGYAVVVWVGFDRNQPVGITGSKAALPVWARFVAGTGLSDAVPHAPEGVVQAEVCEETGRPPCAGCASTRTEWFSAGHVPEPDCGGLFGHGPPVGEGGGGLFRKLGELFGLGRDPEEAPDTPGQDRSAPPEAAPPAEDDARGPDGVPVPR